MPLSSLLRQCSMTMASETGNLSPPGNDLTGLSPTWRGGGAPGVGSHDQTFWKAASQPAIIATFSRCPSLCMVALNMHTPTHSFTQTCTHTCMRTYKHAHTPTESSTSDCTDGSWSKLTFFRRLSDGDLEISPEAAMRRSMSGLTSSTDGGVSTTAGVSLIRSIPESSDGM